MDLFKRTLPFFLIVVGASQKVLKIECPPDVTVKEGSDLILPYKTRPPVNVSVASVEWRRNSKIVHARRKNMEDTVVKDPAFKGRTEIFPDDMGNGNLSLKIYNVTKKDEGIYTVNYTETLSKCSVTVTVEENEERTGDSVVQNGSSLDLSKGDGDGNNTNTSNTETGAIIGIIIAPVIGPPLIIGIYLGVRYIRKRRAKRNGRGGRAKANNQVNIPLQDLRPPAPQNDVIKGEREPLHNNNEANVEKGFHRNKLNIELKSKGTI